MFVAGPDLHDWPCSFFRIGSFTDNDAHVQEAYCQELRYQVPCVDDVDVVGPVDSRRYGQVVGCSS